MRTLLSRATQVDPSFNVGLGLVVILAVAEIGGVTSYYLSRVRTAQSSTQTVATSVARPAVAPVSTPVAVAPATKAAPSPEAVAQTPPATLVDQLLREGVELRDRGDTTNALARFEEALDSEPSNVAVLEEIAKTYDSMQLYDKSNEAWRKLRDIGPSAGKAYDLADQRLKQGVPTPATTDAATTDAGTASASLDAAAASHRDVGGKSEGSVMGITDVKAAETPDPEAETNLALQIGIKKQPGATVDHTKVKILVEFYDTVGDKDVKLTDADVNYEWLTPKHDWTDANPEVLSVSYLRPKTRVMSPEASLSETAASVRPGQKGRSAKGSAADGEKRKYLGYRIRIYYDDKLQAVRAEPSRLLQLFPASENSTAP